RSRSSDAREGRSDGGTDSAETDRHDEAPGLPRGGRRLAYRAGRAVHRADRLLRPADGAPDRPHRHGEGGGVAPQGGAPVEHGPHPLGPRRGGGALRRARSGGAGVSERGAAAGAGGPALEAGAPALVAVARVLRPQGRRGEVRLEPLTDAPARIAELAECWLVPPPAGERRPVEAVWFQGAAPVVKLGGTDTLDAAEGLVGRLLAIPREAVRRLPPDRYYAFD